MFVKFVRAVVTFVHTITTVGLRVAFNACVACVHRLVFDSSVAFISAAVVVFVQSVVACAVFTYCVDVVT